MTNYTPDQTAAAYRLHSTCHELTSILADEPAMDGKPWDDWSESYQTAFRLHDDAEHAYTHAFPDSTTRPEAHDVIAAVTRTRVEVLRAHLAVGWDWVDTFDDSPLIRATCRCGVTADGEPPATGPDACSEESAAAWVLAAHVAAELGRA